ncbi:hypothetical protein NEOLEDRAFT_1133834 [Neolentinus lepideus HHB14362 ss-1]|uniref:Uncharacterized protein n=1 Tax=Neolentinus lepideus HHB14362 ss-1 TaxID=1314782 RepID=A0A165SP06_9AGAM|nr:hypothetical protein NEOLEDRAFT_1133834 [Neolentinus lepideus HHB14362 ss-1]
MAPFERQLDVPKKRHMSRYPFLVISGTVVSLINRNDRRINLASSLPDIFTRTPLTLNLAILPSVHSNIPLAVIVSNGFCLPSFVLKKARVLLTEVS